MLNPVKSFTALWAGVPGLLNETPQNATLFVAASVGALPKRGRTPSRAPVLEAAGRGREKGVTAGHVPLDHAGNENLFGVGRVRAGQSHSLGTGITDQGR